jgi:coatomer protein complex subunit epsilon
MYYTINQPPAFSHATRRFVQCETAIRPWYDLPVYFLHVLTSVPYTGAYKSLAQQLLPDTTSEDFLPVLLYKARSFIALNDPRSALNLVPEDSENVAIRAIASLARYVDATEVSKAEAALEELRDLAIEIEEEVAGVSDKDKALVKVLAGTAFARAGEVEEALETLGTETEDLES